MPGSTTPLTEREKAAILAYKYGILPDLKTAYIVADQQPQSNVLKHSALKNLVSRWANSEKFKTFSEYVDRLIADKEHNAYERGKEQAQTEVFQAHKDSERTQSKQPQAVDYYDPKNQRTQINRIIAESQDDPKTQLDAIKAIQQTQRDDRQAAKDNQIQRFYTPITCKSCPLYLKKRQK